VFAQLDTEMLKARPWKFWPRLLAYTMFEGRPLTTHGRWVNPLVLSFHRLWGALPLSCDGVRPIFILGMGRSGTTVLGRILGLHPDVGLLNEPKALWHSALGDDDLIGSYAPQPGRYRMSAADARREVVSSLTRSYRAFQMLSLSRRVVDKYPELLFRNALLDVAFPEARKIVLVRSGADTCRSVATWSAQNGGGGADWWGRDGRKWQLLIRQLVLPDRGLATLWPVVNEICRSEDMAAVEWIVTMREVLRLRAIGAPNMYYLRYEDLAAKPGEVLPHLLAFAGLKRDRKLLRYAAETLRAPTAGDPPRLHPAIQPLFDETMARMGYCAD